MFGTIAEILVEMLVHFIKQNIWFTDSCMVIKRKAIVAGMLYTQRISDNRMNASLVKQGMKQAFSLDVRKEPFHTYFEFFAGSGGTGVIREYGSLVQAK